MTKIICLANSKKFNERCVAGIEVNDSPSGGFQIIFTDSNPKWLRPVSKCEHGEFPSKIAQDISLLDVIEFDLLDPCPSGYQSENVYFTENSVKKVSSISLSKANLDKLTSQTPTLFGNRGKAVHEDVVGLLDHSLVFIKVNRYNVCINPEKNQLRMTFFYNGTEYDLPITDIQFELLYRKNNNIIENIHEMYLTISLAVEHNNWHSKLVAGVLYIKQ